MSDQQSFFATEEEFSAADAEMARRLLSLRRAPSPALLARVRAVAERPQHQRRRVPRLAWAFMIAILSLTILVVVSPSLRALLQEMVSSTWSARSEYGLMSLDTARDVVPYKFKVPATAPPGWTMNNQVTVGHLTVVGHSGDTTTAGDTTTVLIRWARSGHEPIFLSIQPIAGEPSFPMYVGPNSFRAIDIGGERGIVVAEGRREWRVPVKTTVFWTVGDVQYALWTPDLGVSQPELVRMAESAQ